MVAAPKHFPVQGVVYTPTPTHHPALSRTQLTEYMPALQAAADACDASTVHAPPLKGPCPLVVITHVSDPSHPAYGQCGLTATRALAPGTLVLDYVGQVVDDAHADPASDYTLRLCRGFSMDAARSGNEARFVNDFRGVRCRPNCKFELYRDKSSGGAVRMGVWVVEGLKRGEELLVSYGRGFWNARREAGSDDAEWAKWEQVAADAWVHSD